MTQNKAPKTIIISRTDAIGDVVLTLPMAGVIKTQFPSCKIIFLGRSYTKEIILSSTFVDEYIDYEDFKNNSFWGKIKFLNKLKADTIIHVFPRKDIALFALLSNIKNRIGTSHRIGHLLTVNHKVAFSRKKSDLHEGQLNLKLLSPLGINNELSVSQLALNYGFRKGKLSKEVEALLSPTKFNLILHPFTNGSAREWGINKFIVLANSLPSTDFEIFISGTEKELAQAAPLLRQAPHVISLIGKLDLNTFIQFIAHADGLIAASTGPLHIAAMSGIHAMGIYPPIRPIHPGRWAPIGTKSKVFVTNNPCIACSGEKECACMQAISIPEVLEYIKNCKKINQKTTVQ